MVFVSSILGTGSSRKSATNSILWHIGEKIPYVPNKKNKAIVIADKIAPIFYSTMEDAGAFCIECDTSKVNMGDEIIIYPCEGKIEDKKTNETISVFKPKTSVEIDQIKAGGRTFYIIGKKLTKKAKKFLGLLPSEPPQKKQSSLSKEKKINYTLAQKIVGRACRKEGILPETYCEPKVCSVASQDTTGPMTANEINELGCLKFSAPLVMQSFCHTAAYPSNGDKQMHKDLSASFIKRNGFALKPGDGIVHSWINKMLLPDTVGTGGDSHTRFPIGISFPAGSGLIAFASALGFMPLKMPESVLVKFTGEKENYITIRDLVNSIAYMSIKKRFFDIR